MVSGFKSFLTQSNALALAIGVIIGAAVGNVVGAFANDLLMPLISLMLRSGDWRTSKIVLSTATDATGKVTENAILYGHLIGTIVDFVIIAFVVYLLLKTLVREKVAAPTTKACPECLDAIPLDARRCRSCTAVL
jgi:large conductance mechanosensitive channel